MCEEWAVAGVRTAERQRFTARRVRGWSIAAAAWAVGVSRSAAARWTRGHTVDRNGHVAGFVEPLGRLAVKAISPRHLSQTSGSLIADLRQEGRGIRAIALEFGRGLDGLAAVGPQRPRAGPCRPFDAYCRP